MKASDIDQTSVLLRLLEYQFGQIEVKEQREQKWFEWTTSLLLATFGAVVALSQRSSPLPFSIIIKSIASILIAAPSIIAAQRMLREKSKSILNAETITRIGQLLHLYEGEVYGHRSPLPESWESSFAVARRNRKTPNQFAFIVLIMAICVIATIWLIL